MPSRPDATSRTHGDMHRTAGGTGTHRESHQRPAGIGGILSKFSCGKVHGYRPAVEYCVQIHSSEGRGLVGEYALHFGGEVGYDIGISRQKQKMWNRYDT